MPDDENLQNAGTPSEDAESAKQPPGSPTYEDRVRMRQALLRAKRQQFASAEQRGRLQAQARKMRLGKFRPVELPEAQSSDFPPPPTGRDETLAPFSQGIPVMQSPVGGWTEEPSEAQSELPGTMSGPELPSRIPREPSKPSSSVRIGPEGEGKATRPGDFGRIPGPRQSLSEPEFQALNPPLEIGEPPDVATARRVVQNAQTREERYAGREPSPPAPQLVGPDLMPEPVQFPAPELPLGRRATRADESRIQEEQGYTARFGEGPGLVEARGYAPAAPAASSEQAEGVTAEQAGQMVDLLRTMSSHLEEIKTGITNLSQNFQGLRETLSELGGYGP